MDRACAAGIKESCAEREVDAKLREPAAIPDPVRGQRKSDSRQHRGNYAAAHQSQTVGARTPRQHGGHGYRQKLEDERQLGLRACAGNTTKQEGAEAEHVPCLSYGVDCNF